MSDSSAPPAIRASDLHVRYGRVTALRGVDWQVDGGSVHALVGENGAGKSSLVRALVGLVPASGGRAELLGRGRLPDDPGEAEAWGAALAPQEIDLCDDLRVFEQVTLGREPRRAFGFLDRPRQRSRAEVLLARVAPHLDPERLVAAASPSDRKLVQIARALAGDPQLLFLDEPTAALDEAGARAVGRLLRAHADAGGAAVLISHRIAEVVALCDTVTVLRDGRRVSTDPAAGLDAGEIVRRMVGRAIPPRARPPEAGRRGEVALHFEGSVPLVVRRGEILGLAGLVGAGRSETLEAIAVAHRDRVALVPEDRARKGLVPTFGLRENLHLPAPSPWLRPRAERDATRGWCERLAIRAAGPDAAVASLSGGNQQKLLLARALRRDPEIVLLDEPTQGVDVAAKAEIHGRIRALADAGRAVVMASSDLPELLQLADRIAVLRDGKKVGEVDPRDGEEAVMARAAGVAA